MKYATPERFADTCVQTGVSVKNAHRVWKILESSYSEAHRHYHNLAHIDKMLGRLDASSQRSDTLELAIWFHDIVYNPLGGENEIESSRVFEKHLGPFMTSHFNGTVNRLILATIPSRERTGESDENLIIDIDLSTLGASRKEYQSYSLAIRKEYSEVPDIEFSVGRISILRQFLSRPIFATDFFSELEVPARENILWELSQLERRA